ncbi:MAG: DUF4258 domain-containing protein, partial [Chloroflexota bacterium]
PIIWTKHAWQNLADRELDRAEVEQTIRQPEVIVPDPPGRQILMRRYRDKLLGKEMLLRVIVSESGAAITVITVYKTSQIGRYWKGR